MPIKNTLAASFVLVCCRAAFLLTLLALCRPQSQMGPTSPRVPNFKRCFFRGHLPLALAATSTLPSDSRHAGKIVYGLAACFSTLHHYGRCCSALPFRWKFMLDPMLPVRAALKATAFWTAQDFNQYIVPCPRT
jgi:hypothetical protein